MRDRGRESERERERECVNRTKGLHTGQEDISVVDDGGGS